MVVIITVSPVAKVGTPDTYLVDPPVDEPVATVIVGVDGLSKYHVNIGVFPVVECNNLAVCGPTLKLRVGATDAINPFQNPCWPNVPLYGSKSEVTIKSPNVPTSDAVVNTSCDREATTPSTSACRVPASPSYDNVVPEPLVAATNVQLAVGLVFAVTVLYSVGVTPLAVYAEYVVALVVNARVLKLAGFAGANFPRINSILSNASSALSPEVIPETFPAEPPYAPSVGNPIITIPPEI